MPFAAVAAEPGRTPARDHRSGPARGWVCRTGWPSHPSVLGWTNKRLPTGSFFVNGHGGSYQVNVHWQVAS